MSLMPAEGDRLFVLVDARSRHAVGICNGPGPSGECPSYVPGQPLPCEGRRVVPMRRTSVNGLPFLVDPSEGNRCPLAWVDSVTPEVAEPGDAAPESR
ncbi:MAG TPA: hypothetical protein VEK76_07255 [Candidatus Binatia bacterium]|nr:hypothetical protein [Candidatus Binatia bacterium]